MELAFSTAAVHPRDRFDYWQFATRERIADHDSWTPSRESFDAELSVGRLGSLGLVTSRNSPIEISCTSRHAARANSDEILLFSVTSGRVLLEQRDRRVSSEAGSLLCVDPRLAHTMHFLEQQSALIIKVPRRELELRLGANVDLAARQIEPSNPQDRLALSFVASLGELSGTVDSACEETVATQAIDLIAMSIEKQAGQLGQLPSNKSHLIWRIHRAIEARLQSPDLNPEQIADRVGMSVRQANKLLAGQGSSLMRLVQSKRLDRCRQALSDPNQAHRSVSDIALGWGFSDLTHFSRCFRRAYGILPRDFRRIANGA